MRDYLIITLLFGSLPFALRSPFVGVLLWCWVGYANPHRYTWRLVDFPIAMVVGVVTIVGLIFSRERKRIPWTTETILLAIQLCWFAVTTYFAFYPDDAVMQLDKVAKILLMTFITLIVVQSKPRFDLLFIVIAASLGVIALWGMIWGILNGGQSTYYGPPDSMIADNNELALALNMMLPFCVFIPKNVEHPAVRIAAKGLFVASVVTIILTFSRGGFLGLCTVFVGLFLRVRNKIPILFAVATLIIVGSLVIPPRWFERMNTIETYEQDASAMGRINAWWVAFRVAQDRPFVGGGFEMFSSEQFRKYAPNPNDVHDVHSIYFEVLGEHGFVGFFLYTSLIVASIMSLLKMTRTLRGHPHFHWYVNYCDMLLISICAFLVNGATLGRAYFDLFYHLIAGVILLQAIYKKEIIGLVLENCVEASQKARMVPADSITP